MADKAENNEPSEGNLPTKSTPKDALVMGAILKEMGINEYEPKVINQMLEYTYRELVLITINLITISTYIFTWSWCPSDFGFLSLKIRLLFTDMAISTHAFYVVA